MDTMLYENKRILNFGKWEDMDYGTKEACNSLRTNIKFCGGDIKVIILTSSIENEGKSTVALNLVRSLAEDNKKVLLIDADLRKSVLVATKKIRVRGEARGLAHYLSGQATLDEIIYTTNVENLEVVMAGPMTPNPTELLGSDAFKRLVATVRDNYDFVIIDTPPLGTVIDTAVIAPICDGAIMIIESEVISYKLAQMVKKQLEVTGCHILGVVLNKVEISNGGYYNHYYKGYYKKDYK